MEDKLNILWTNDNPETAHTMVFMYGINAKKNAWFNDVEIIIWGPTAKLVSENTSIQDKIQLAMHTGVIVKACLSCATMYGVVDKLVSLGIETIPMGQPLTEILKSNQKLLTI